MIRFAGSPSPYFASARPLVRSHFGNVTEVMLDPTQAEKDIQTLVTNLSVVNGSRPLREASNPLLQKVAELVPTLLGSGKVTLQVTDADNNTYSLSKLTALGNTVIELTPKDKKEWVLQSSNGKAFIGLTFKSPDTNSYDFTEYPLVHGENISQSYANKDFCKEIHEQLAALFPAH